ncbi:MAG: hypothetical protein QXV01_10165, partial [Candidatus Bathyarchaeia archaeon]
MSLGTDFPEITNSIVSSALGHGDINIGDSFGSVLTQITLILGLFPFLGGIFKVERDEITVLGACEALALITTLSMTEKGYISWLNAVFLVASWPLFMLITRKVAKKSAAPTHTSQRLFLHILAA